MMKRMLLVSTAVLVVSQGLAFAQGTGTGSGGTGSSVPSAPSTSSPSAAPSASPTSPSATTSPSTTSPTSSAPKAGDPDASKGAQSTPGTKATTTDQKAGSTTNPAADRKAGDTKSGATETKPDATGTKAGSGGAAAAPPAEKRTEISSAFKQEKVTEVTNVNFNVSVGTTIPAGVSFHPVPSRIVTIYPQWRGYEYVFVRGKYVIVRPQTREIVYIIEG